MSPYHNLVEALEELQDNRCGICSRGRVRDHVIVDHDHDTGFVRGLLCRSCNVAEGNHRQCERDVDRCPICRWRYQPAVAWLGWTVAYVGPGIASEYVALNAYRSTRDRIADDEAQWKASSARIRAAFAVAMGDEVAS